MPFLNDSFPADQKRTSDLPEAERAARAALAHDPTSPEAARNLGVLLREAERHHESAEILQQAAVLHPDDAPVQCELGTTLALMGEHRHAFRHLREAVRIDPDLQVAYLNLGAVLYEQGRHADAIGVNRIALRLKPDCPLAHYNQANALRELGQLHEAAEYFAAALRHQPEFPRAYFNLGLTHLLLGNFREGWTRFEAREAAGEIVLDKYPQPLWDGAPLPGKRLLVHAEQGIGDEILFATCIAELVPQVGELVLTCDPRLEKLFARSFPQVRVQPFVRQRDSSPAPVKVPCDAQIPAGSLPLHLRPSLESFPRQSQLLLVDPTQLANWRRRLDALGPGLKVGISWRAGGRSSERLKRTIPLTEWHEILSVPGVQFINLQYNDASDDLAQVKDQLGIEIHDGEDADPLVDLDSFAAKIAALDLVISVGNATVHLAGAVGTPAWTMLPMVPSWRWMVAGDESPWYATVRLFRQSVPGEWEPVVDRLAGLLRERVGIPSTAAPETKRAGTPGRLAAVPKVAVAPAMPMAGPAEIREPDHWLPPADVLGRIDDNFLVEPLKRAEAHCKVGEYVAAEALYREILQLAPRQISAHNGLGLVAWKTGRLDLAVRSFHRALALADDAYDGHYYLASVLAISGRLEEAVGHYIRVVRLAPGFRAGHLELGLALQRLGRDADALLPLQAAQSLDALDFDAYLYEGRSLMKLCRIDAARSRFEAAAQRAPECAAIWEALGESYSHDQEYRRAEECLRHAVALAPDNGSARYQLARMLQADNRPQEALEAYEQVLTLDPNCVEAMFDLATVRQGLGNLPGAAALLERVAILRPEEPQVHNALGAVLAAQDKTTEALDHYARALRLNPGYAAARVNRAFALLREGNLEQAWRDYESRWQLSNTARPRTFLNQPLWNGSPLAGQTILIHAEQSLGDEIALATCYPDVIEQAAHCIILCAPKLAALLRRAFPQATVCPVARGREQSWTVPATQIDWQIPAGSLPRLLRSHAASFPRHPQLLTPDPARFAQATARLAALPAGRKVGIAWHGNEQPQARPAASLLGWQPLLSVPGIQFVNLQLGDSAAELGAAASRGSPLVHVADWRSHQDLEELAATIAALDLVIAVESTTLHLAGSLGVATWALCPHAPLGVTWLAGDEQQSLWYGNMRIFRSQRLGSQGELIRQARENLLHGVPHAADQMGMRGIVGPHWVAGVPSAQLQ